MRALCFAPFGISLSLPDGKVGRVPRHSPCSVRPKSRKKPDDSNPMASAKRLRMPHVSPARSFSDPFAATLRVVVAYGHGLRISEALRTFVEGALPGGDVILPFSARGTRSPHVFRSFAELVGALASLYLLLFFLRDYGPPPLTVKKCTCGHFLPFSISRLRTYLRRRWHLRTPL